MAVVVVVDVSGEIWIVVDETVVVEVIVVVEAVVVIVVVVVVVVVVSVTFLVSAQHKVKSCPSNPQGLWIADIKYFRSLELIPSLKIALNIGPHCLAVIYWHEPGSPRGVWHSWLVFDRDCPKLNLVLITGDCFFRIFFNKKVFFSFFVT